MTTFVPKLRIVYKLAHVRHSGFSGLQLLVAILDVSFSRKKTVVWRRTYAKVHLERIINEPLERRQSTNHEDPDRQTVPQPTEANLAVYPANRLARALASLAIIVEF